MSRQGEREWRQQHSTESQAARARLEAQSRRIRYQLAKYERIKHSRRSPWERVRDRLARLFG